MVAKHRRRWQRTAMMVSHKRNVMGRSAGFNGLRPWEVLKRWSVEWRQDSIYCVTVEVWRQVSRTAAGVRTSTPSPGESSTERKVLPANTTKTRTNKTPQIHASPYVLATGSR